MLTVDKINELEIKLLNSFILPVTEDVEGSFGIIALTELKAKLFSHPFHKILYSTYRNVVDSMEKRGEKTATKSISHSTIFNELAFLSEKDQFYCKHITSSDQLICYLSAYNRHTTRADFFSACDKLKKAYLWIKARQVCQRAMQALDSTDFDQVETLTGTIVSTMETIKLEIAPRSYKVLGSMKEELKQAHLALRKGTTRILPTGLKSLDALLSFGGFIPGQLIVLASKTGGGKTSAALSFAFNFARPSKAKIGVPTYYVTREMLELELALRLEAAYYDKLLLRDIRPGMATDVFNILEEGLDDFIKTPLIFDSSTSDLLTLRAQTRELISLYDIQGIVVDYLQLMEPGFDGDSKMARKIMRTRSDEVSSMSKFLKKMALDFKIPILALSQISREGVKSGTPQNEHLKEGAIENDADIVIYIDVPTLDGTELDDLIPIKIRVTKQRNGPVGYTNAIFKRSDLTYHAVKAGSALDDSFYSSSDDDFLKREAEDIISAVA